MAGGEDGDVAQETLPAPGLRGVVGETEAELPGSLVLRVLHGSWGQCVPLEERGRRPVLPTPAWRLVKWEVSVASA